MEAQRLTPPEPGRPDPIGTAERPRPLEEDLVELQPDGVEAHGLRGPGVQHPEPHPLPGPGCEGPVPVLEGDAVEGEQVRGLRGDLGRIGLPALGAEVDLRLDDDVLAVHRGQVRRVDDDGPVHARGQVDAHGRGGAVVEPDPGALGRELVDE